MVRGTLARYMDSMLLPEPGDDAELTRRGTEIVARAPEPYQARLIGRAARSAVAVIVSRAPVVIGVDATAREAADLIVREAVGRLPVLERGRLVGIVTRSDLLEAH